jgi:predicted RecB family nuclease
MNAHFPLQQWPLTELPGLRTEDYQTLQALGVETTADLLRHTQTTDHLRKFAAQLQQPERWVRKWVALATLSQLPSVGCQYCGLLLHVGVTSIAQLATLSAQTLHRRILRLQTTLIQRRDRCPHPGIVRQWIQDAQQYQRQCLASPAPLTLKKQA